MENFAIIAFIFYGMITVSGACMAVFCRSLVRALVGLIGAMFGVAGMYLLLASPLIAFMQILVYVGGVCVLIFFAIMLTSSPSEAKAWQRRTKGTYIRGTLAALAPAGILSWIIIRYPPESLLIPKRISVVALGEGLLQQYLLPFELISVILFVAMAGAVFLAWKAWGKR
ncbi:MAG: NADH-quinone oxidoreductase subunit J [Deltaproteobacteria bacterium]|nr:NADH-quinone oxidoreductase subunit J [Deltaproteobacteria bacterium]